MRCTGDQGLERKCLCAAVTTPVTDMDTQMFEGCVHVQWPVLVVAAPYSHHALDAVLDLLPTMLQHSMQLAKA